MMQNNYVFNFVLNKLEFSCGLKCKKLGTGSSVAN